MDFNFKFPYHFFNYFFINLIKILLQVFGLHFQNLAFYPYSRAASRKTSSYRLIAPSMIFLEIVPPSRPISKAIFSTLDTKV